jgi:hypothetical protein
VQNQKDGFDVIVLADKADEEINSIRRHFSHQRVYVRTDIEASLLDRLDPSHCSSVLLVNNGLIQERVFGSQIAQFRDAN